MEILADVEEQDLDKDSFRILKELLQLADLVKFAKYIPVNSENENIVQWAQQFVQNTKIELIQSVKQPEKINEEIIIQNETN